MANLACFWIFVIWSALLTIEDTFSLVRCSRWEGVGFCGLAASLSAALTAALEEGILDELFERSLEEAWFDLLSSSGFPGGNT